MKPRTITGHDQFSAAVDIANLRASVLLVIGYPLALGVLARLRLVLAERRVWWFAALEAATATITGGWLLHRRPLPAAINGAARVGFAIACLITGQRGPPGPSDRTSDQLGAA